jgi:hypothetical protein
MKKDRKWIDLTGRKFGRLTVLALHPERYRYGKQTVPRWLCRCDCGAETVVRGYHLRSGNTASCGCARIEKLKRIKTTHGLAKSRAYQAWHNMKSRCLNPNYNSYSYYGGRGISFDERWREFDAFYADVGDPPDGLSLDRPDNDGNYGPTNWRWTDRSTQNRNRRGRAKRKKQFGGKIT